MPGSRVIPPRLLLIGLLAACLPDLDVLAFKLGIAYDDALGHRGFSHSLLFAGLVGILGALCCRLLDAGPCQSGLWIAVACAAHSLLGALTDGSLGVAWLWPWSEQRYSLPCRPIAVSPFIDGFFSPRGLAVLASEARWVWLPCLGLAITGVGLRRVLAQQETAKKGGECRSPQR